MWLAKIASAFQTHKITGDGLLDLPTIDLTAGLISRNVLTLKVVHGMGLASENAWGSVIVQLQQGRPSSHARSAAATIRRRGLSPAVRNICSRKKRRLFQQVDANWRQRSERAKLRDIRKYRDPATGRLLWYTHDERVWKQNACTIHSPNSTDSVICVSA